MIALLSLFACDQDIGIQQNAICDGSVQPSEDYVDEPFDRDGDGYFDADNPDCAAVYPAESLDCDDGNADVNPGADEIACNGWDDDCDAETEDEADVDDDGFPNCDDCDDLNPDVYPGNSETECNGLDDDCNEDTLDDPDVDEDDYTVCEGDCDDIDANINPGAEEVPCNDVDDDCSSATPDAEDKDGDTWSTCDGDCDDNESTAWPGYEEICDDEIDNDCDGEWDEDCELDYTDTWFLDTSISYDCAYGFVELSFSIVDITHSGTNIAIYGGGTGGQPGTTTGTLDDSDQSFETDRTVTGGCDETYQFIGEFTNADTFEGVFKAKFVGSCYDCSNKTWSIVGTR